MSGMSGVSGAGSMSKSCGMESMHPTSANKQPGKIQDEGSNQIAQTNKIPNKTLGNTIDLTA